MEIHSNELLNDITAFAEMLLTKNEIALNLDFDPILFDSNSDYQRAYLIGKQKAVTTHKKKILVLAKQGSGPAQNMLEKLRTEINLNDIRNAWE